MDAGRHFREAITALKIDRTASLACDSRTQADYIQRLGREGGINLTRRKLETGGWELKAARRRGARSMGEG
jgi:hypothetical protein